jgi:uncharacterized protein YndB with AHSA1/START domain
MATSEIQAKLLLHVDADADTTFDAWIVPAVMERWLFKSPSNRLVAKTNPVSGGSYSIVEYDAGSVITHDGVYSHVERPKRLAFSLLVPQHFAGTAQIEVTIVPEGRKSRLEFLARGAGPDNAQQIWEKMLANLAAVIKRMEQ